MSKFISKFNLIRFFLIITTTAPTAVAANNAELQRFYLTDVTGSGFTIMKFGEKDQTFSIKIFSDKKGENEITNSLILDYFPLIGGSPNLQGYQERKYSYGLKKRLISNGITRIRVNGCVPDTTYYYKLTYKSDTSTKNELDKVRTTNRIEFSTNSKPILLDFVPNEKTPDITGWPIIAFSKQFAYPISSLIGDGAGTNQAFLNIDQGTGQIINIEVLPFDSEPFQYTIVLNQESLQLSTVNLMPTIIKPKDIKINNDEPIPQIKIRASDFETGNQNLMINVRSSNWDIISKAILVRKTDTDFIIILTKNKNRFGTATIFVSVQDGYGLYKETSFDVTIIQPLMGDFNNDGSVTLDDIIIGLQIQAEMINDNNISYFDVNDDHKQGIQEIIFSFQKLF